MFENSCNKIVLRLFPMFFNVLKSKHLRFCCLQKKKRIQLSSKVAFINLQKQSTKPISCYFRLEFKLNVAFSSFERCCNVACCISTQTTISFFIIKFSFRFNYRVLWFSAAWLLTNGYLSRVLIVFKKKKLHHMRYVKKRRNQINPFNTASCAQ